MHESILAFKKRRYLWLALSLLLLCVLVYWLDDPQQPPNGGTPLGYALGALATAMILMLAWFGVRKRRYASNAGSVQGWLSAHVYLGLALPVIAALHAGFQFGPNIHTLAFVLLALVVASGIYGVVIYMKYPGRMSSNRDGASRQELFDQLDDLDRRSRRAAAGLPDDFAELVQSAASRTQLGGSLWQRLRARDRSQVVLPQQGQRGAVPNAGQEAALDWLAEQQSRASDADSAAKIGELSALLRTRRQVLQTLREDLRLQAALDIWLYFHVPISVGLLAALAAHIFSVFVYW